MALGKSIQKGISVYDAALDRIRTAFDRFDHVSVSFSGGKDSTTVLMLVLQVAREKGRLPLDVYHFDEEAIHPPTVDYVERVSKMKDINFKWFCLPIKHRNACSRKQPWWYTWNPNEKEKWVRDLPEGAITYLKGFQIGMDIPGAIPFIYPEVKGTKITLLGIRTEESLRRYRAVTKRAEDNWMSLRGGKEGSRGYPIYDWNSNDVWIAVQKFKWDYNKTYDVLMRYGFGALKQRVCPPYGEEPLRGFQLYKDCFPQMWAKMVMRVHGANTAMLYSNTELYAINIESPPAGMSWREYMEINLQLYPKKDRKRLTASVNECIELHYHKSITPITEEDPDLVSGCSWKFLCKMVIRGDFKGRYQGVMTREADKIREKYKVDVSELISKYGTEQYKKEYFSK